jgi:PAS domain S-box-containing protein
MTNKLKQERLTALFADLERLSADPLSNTHEISQQIEALRTRIAEIEKKFMEEELLNASSSHELKQAVSNPRNTANNILYERDQLGYHYSDDRLEPLHGNIQSLPSTDGVTTSLLTIGDQTIGEMQIESAPEKPLTQSDMDLVNTISQQATLQIQNLRLLAATERSRAEAENATRRFLHESWDSYLDAINRNERIGFAYDQSAVTPYDNKVQNSVGLHKTVQVMDEEVGTLYLKPDPARPLTEADKELVDAVANQIAQQVENIRLLADASRSRAEAEEAIRRLTKENWETFTEDKNTEETNLGFVYDSVQVSPINENTMKEEIVLSQPLMVRGEEVGQLAIAGFKDLPPYAAEMALSIATQASTHLETLRLAEEVQKSQERFELAVRGSDDGVWDWDIAKDTIYYSPRWKSMLGFEEHELTKGFADWEDRIHPEDRDRAVKVLDDYLAQKIDEYDVEVRLRHKDNHYVWVRDRGKALRREDGTAFRMAGAHTDISERKRAEELIAQRANQLETVATVSTTASTVLNPDALLQQVVNLTKTRFGLYHAHVYLLDENWNTLLLAAGAGEVGVKMVEAGHAIDMSVEQSFVARSARTKQAVVVNDVRNEEGFLPNESLPNTRSEMAIPMIVGDNVLGVFDVQSDTVDAFSREDANIYSTLASQVAVALQNARLYQEQSATVVQLRELDRLKSSFLANMSHELRTPLNSILGFTDVMLEGLDGPLTSNMDNDLKLINKNGQHLLHLINDVLDMAKIESGKMNLIIEKFNLHEIFEEVVNITSPLANEKKLTLKVEAKSDQDIEINADRTRLRQVMINLINNALKFTEKGKVTIRAIREENNILISVKDTGIGIPTAQLEDVFSEFTQVDSSTTRKSGGTGLGLPISRKLVEMHGGKLWAESTGVEGEGSTFFVFMPIENRTAVSEPVTRKID